MSTPITARWLLFAMLLVGTVSSAFAQSNPAAHFIVERFQVVGVDPTTHVGRLAFSARVNVPGRLTVQLHLHGQGSSRRSRVGLLSGDARIVKAVVAGDRIEREWNIVLPDDGYMELGSVGLELDTAGEAGHGGGISASYFLFAHMKGGRVTASGNAPLEEFMRPPVRVYPPISVKEKGRSVQSDITINVNIAGRITCRDRSDNIDHGVPNVGIEFDWDLDDDDATIASPFYSGGASMEAYTDADGYYSFVRQVVVPSDHWVWSTPHIRMHVHRGNEAAYNGAYGEQALFGQQSLIPLSISPSSPDISVSDNDLQVETVDGNALRFLWRAREFDIHDLAGPGGIPDPPLLKYYYTPDSDPDARDNFQGSGPKINFIDIPIAQITYHEYGHYIQWLYGESIDAGNCPHHDFDDRTNEACAIREGWAEFHSAAAQAYWWMREGQTRREGDYDYDPHLAFLDNGPSHITTNTSDEEGAFATFLYNLWDDKGTRAIGSSTPSVPYVGDNDDLDNGRPFGHPRPWLVYCLNRISRYKYLHVVNPIMDQWRWVRVPPYFDAYRENYLAWVKQWYPVTSSYHEESINAMYADFTNGQDAFRAATPTSLTVTGNQSSRTLQWNDHTCPAQYNFLTELETSGSGTVQLDDNDEAGFVIWRRRLSAFARIVPPQEPGAIADGRLERQFQRIAIVGPNTHTYFDTQQLPKGSYEYVVVACRQWSNNVAAQLSIPKAKASISIAGSITIKDGDGWDECQQIKVIKPGEEQVLIASKDGTASHTTQWITTNKPGFIALSGAMSDTLTIANDYQSGVSTIPSPFGPFSVRCVMTTSGVADTSDPFFPSFTPLDSANRFLRVVTDAGMPTDTTSARGMEFMARPGDEVISIQRLAVVPKKDSAYGYQLLINGPSTGSLDYDMARLYYIEHPTDMVVDGSALCGYRVYRHVGSTLVEDSSGIGGMHELPLTFAYSTLGDTLTNVLLAHDTLQVSLSRFDTMLVRFDDPAWEGDTMIVMDSTFVPDTSRQSWTRTYFVELHGAYHDNLFGNYAVLPTASVEENALTGYMLGQAQPNPARTSASIAYTLGGDDMVSLELYDDAGRMVKSLVNQRQERGAHSIEVGLEDVATGRYFYRIHAGAWNATRMLTVLH